MMTQLEVRFYEMACAFFARHNRKQDKNEIDWEQRRWDLVCRMGGAREGAPYGKGVDESAERIVKEADALIAEYRKTMHYYDNLAD